MSAELSIRIKAIDEATEGIRRVAEETKKAGEAINQANQQVAKSAEQVSQAKQRMVRASEEADASLKKLVTGISGVATAAFALYQGWDKLQDMQVTINRANLQVQTSLNTLEDAQRRYNAAVERYGPLSEQAEAALKDVQLAQERYNVAVERAEMVQGNYQEAVVSFALSVIPTAITAIDSLIKVKQNLTSIIGGVQTAVGALSGALSFLAANPIVLVMAAAAGLILALKHLYDTNEAFRNAVNALGSALLGYLKPAIEAITAALTFLWNNLIKPIADAFGWLVSVIMGAFRSLTGASEKAKTGVTQDFAEVQDQATVTGDTVQTSIQQARTAVTAFAESVKASETTATTSFRNIAASAQRMGEAVYQGYVMVAEGVWVAADALKRAALESAKTVGQAWDRLEAHRMRAARTAAGGGVPIPAWPGQPIGRQYGSLIPTAPTAPIPPFKLEPVETLPGGLVVYRLIEGQRGFEGLVRRPTLFLAGEAGPEYVSIRPQGREPPINVQVNVEGGVDERVIAKVLHEVERALRSVIFEKTSSRAPDWSRMIRFG